MDRGNFAEKLPALFLGTERFGNVLPGHGLGSATSDRELVRFLDEAVGLGAPGSAVVGIDTAASYQIGGTERFLGRWLRQSSQRARVFLSSKGGHPVPLLRPNRLGVSDLTSDLEDSLKRLGTDYLDLYLLHRDHPDADLEAIVDWMTQKLKRGVVRRWGVSNWHHERVHQLERVATRMNAEPPTVSSPQFSLSSWSKPLWKGCVSISGPEERSARAFYERSQIAVVAYSALGRGLFSDGGGAVEFDHGVNHGRRDRARELAKRLELTPAQVALAYLTSQPFPVHPVIATRSSSHLAQNLAAVSVRLSPSDCRWLEDGSIEEGATRA